MTRAAASLALACTAALAIWFTGRLALGETAQATGVIAVGALLIVQGIAAALAAPWLACDGRSAQLTGLAPLLVTPWPLLVVAVNVSGVSALMVATSQVCVLALLVLSYFGARGLMRLLRAGQARNIALTFLQVVPAISLWAVRDSWLPWFTS